MRGKAVRGIGARIWKALNATLRQVEMLNCGILRKQKIGQLVVKEKCMQMGNTSLLLTAGCPALRGGLSWANFTCHQHFQETLPCITRPDGDSVPDAPGSLCGHKTCP